MSGVQKSFLGLSLRQMPQMKVFEFLLLFLFFLLFLKTHNNSSSSLTNNVVVFKAGTSGFMKKKGLGTITIVLSDLENGVPVDDFFPLVHKGEKEGGSIRIQIIKITTSIVWTTRDFLMPIHALLNAERHDSLVTLLKQVLILFNIQSDQLILHSHHQSDAEKISV